MTAALRASLAFFYLSGMTGLIYEVLWTRRLTLTFGHTVLAVSTVLTAFMAGLALGSLAAGRASDRLSDRDPIYFLKIYGWLETFVGVWALLSLPLLGVVEATYLKLATSGVQGTPLFLACFAGSMVVLVPPTTAMGATVPVMSKLLVHEKGDIGRLLSRLYGINTLGAVTGSALAGFLLLPALGLKLSLVLAAVVNLAIGAGAIYLGGRPGAGPQRRELEAPAVEEEATEDAYPSFLVPLCFGLAGVASMAYQVGWTRALALSLGSSVYAFSAILVTFLTGLGLGSLLYPKVLGKREPRLRDLAWLQLGVGTLGGLTVPALGALPFLFYHLFKYVQESFVRVMLLDLSLAALVLIGPTFLMGLAFPLATHLYTKDLRLLGRSVGAVYSANTFGCIFGSFAAGFWLVPYLGAQYTLQLASALNLLVCVLLLTIEGRKTLVPTVVAALLCVGVLLLPKWREGVMGGGIAVYAERHQGMSLEQLNRTLFRPPAFYKDGLSCTVSVNFYGRDQMAMRVNGKVDASLGKTDKQTMYLTGYLPGLLHKGPKSVAVVGLGSGLTLQALANVPGVEKIECAELEPAVVQAGYYWKGFNGAVLDDPRVKMHLTDGRTFILGSPQKYDIIASEPSNPWIAGIGNLFTRDFYETCRNRLNPGGVMCQWFNLYAVSEQDLAMVLHSFFDVFPHGMVWQSAPGDLLLIGSETEVPLDLERVRQIWSSSPEVQRQFYEIGLEQPEQLLGHFLLTREKALEAFGKAPFNTDDRPLLEFSAPLSVVRPNQVARNIQVLREIHRTTTFLPPGFPMTPQTLLWACMGWLNTGNFQAVQAAAGQLPEGPERSRMEGLAARLDNKPDVALDIYKKALQKWPQDVRLQVALGLLCLEKELWAEAGEHLDAAMKDPPPGSQATLAYARGEAWAGLKKWAEAAQAFYLAAPYTLSSSPFARLGEALRQDKELQKARNALNKALDRNQCDADAWLWSGQILLQQGHAEEAVSPLKAALQLVPDNLDTLFALALCYMKLEKLAEATEVLEQLVRYYPDHVEGQQYLAKLRSLK